MVRRRTLADDLAELTTTVPAEYDPEADVLHQKPKLEDSDDELLPLAASRKAPEGRRLRAQGDIGLNGAAYQGKATSRAALFGNEESEPSTSEDDSEPSEEGSVDEEAGFASQASGSEASEEPTNLEATDEEAEADVQPELPSYQGNGGADDAELAALDQEYAQLAAQDAGLTDGLHQRQQKQQRKGAAVANQCRVWENALQLRIMLQRCLQAAHQLPPAALQPICCAADSGVATAYSEVSQAASSTLDSLLELQAALIGQHPAAAQAVAAAAAAAPPSQGTGLPNGHAPEANGTAPLANGTAGRKRGREAAAPENDQGNEGSVPERKWQRIDEAYRLLAPFRDASVDRWHRKTMLASGGIVSRGNLRALNQSVSSQVAALLRSSDKAVQRTALSGTDRPRVLCAPGHRQAPAASAADQPLQQAVEAGVAIATAPTGAVEPDNETFDDAEFYAQLLKEFLEASGSAGPGLIHTAQGRKRRKQVDRRASKGRKLRFHVQDKLVSFMSPVEAAADAMAPKLFRNLFGIKA